jgi:tyrosine-protein kinase Etk/Wzc
MDNQDNLLGVIQTIFRWKKTIRNVCLVTFIGALALSLLMDDYYQATTIFYPASPELANPEQMFGNTGNITNYFGTDHDLDRTAEIANSAELMEFMIHKFDLYNHYGIDSTTNKRKAKVREIFRGQYVATTNKNDAIEINVEDTDPALAALMANTACEKVNEISQRLTKESQAKLLSAFVDQNLKQKYIDLKILGDSLQKLQIKYGVFDMETPGEYLSKTLVHAESEITRSKGRLEILENNAAIPRDTIEYIKANLRAYEKERNNLRSSNNNSNINIKDYSEGYPKVMMLKDLHFQARKQLSFDLERYNQIKSSYNTNIPAIHVIERASNPLIKSRPKRSLIVIGAVLAAFLFTLLGAMIADNYRHTDWKELLK